MNEKYLMPLTGELLEEDIAECSLFELAEMSGVPAETLVEYVEVGLIEPVSGAAAREWRFAGMTLARLHRARRLQHDFALEPDALALVLDLLEEIDRLRAHIAVLEGGGK